MAKIIIPTPLRKFTLNQSTVAVKSGTVLESIKDLTNQFPELDKHLFTEDDQLRGFVRIFIGEDDIEDLKGSRLFSLLQQCIHKTGYQFVVKLWIRKNRTFFCS